MARRADTNPGDPFETALRALRHRDHTAASLDERLERRGVPALEREQVVARLRVLGYLDDERFAEARAGTLAGRGCGDLMIAHDLARLGVPDELARAVLDRLAPEAERAAAVAARRGGGPRTLRFLAARGFSEEALNGVVANSDETAVG